MNLEELRSVQRAERQKDSLQHLRDSFYEDVADYIAQLKDERERAVERADDPFASEDVRHLTDTLESTKEIANALYERRVGKVVKHASFAAADMATDEEGMTVEERELFEDLVARIRENRQSVFATLEGAGERDSADAPDPAPSPVNDETETATDAASPTESETAPDPADDLLADALGDSNGATGTTAAADTSGEEDADRRPDDSSPAPTGADGAPSRPADEAAAVSGDVGEGDTEGVAATSTAAETDTEADAAGDVERATLRITADVGTVYGVDEREYDLAREDVVWLPETNAEPLLQKNAAERID